MLVKLSPRPVPHVQDDNRAPFNPKHDTVWKVPKLSDLDPERL